MVDIYILYIYSYNGDYKPTCLSRGSPPCMMRSMSDMYWDVLSCVECCSSKWKQMPPVVFHKHHPRLPIHPFSRICVPHFLFPKIPDYPSINLCKSRNLDKTHIPVLLASFLAKSARTSPVLSQCGPNWILTLMQIASLDTYVNRLSTMLPND